MQVFAKNIGKGGNVCSLFLLLPDFAPIVKPLFLLLFFFLGIKGGKEEGEFNKDWIINYLHIYKFMEKA